MFIAILGLFPAIIFSIILFLINPILGILWVVWLALIAVWAIRKDSIMKFFVWLFGDRK